MEPLSESIDRRSVLRMAGFGGAAWLTGVAQLLAREEELAPQGRPARSIILLWLAGGPSQLETFDPHPGTNIAAGTKAIDTVVPGLQLAEGFERLADQMADVSLVRSLVSKEGDHERGTYMVKTGFRPDPTLVHPSIGAVACHQLPLADVEIPRHISIFPGQWPGRGGYLGGKFDAFKTFDPKNRVPDVTERVQGERAERRLEDLQLVERVFSQRRKQRAAATRHRETIAAARRMMDSEQLDAFDISEEPASVQARYGDTRFGRGCLAARRLIEVGVRCVEVTLGGWDSHANNHETHRELAATLDPALAALIADLRERKLLEHTIVLCGGEFGRTPRVNPAGGRDHWPNNFCFALAGGGLRGGRIIGESDPEGGKRVVDPHPVADIHTTVLTALGIEPHKELDTPIGRPMKLSEGSVLRKLVADG